MELSKDQIKKYSKMFNQPESVVECISNMYNTKLEIEKNLYELGEDELPEDSEIENNDIYNDDFEESEESLKEKLAGLFNIFKNINHIPNNVEILNLDIFHHVCPFNDEQQKQVNCDICPLHGMNFVKLASYVAKQHNCSILHAVEIIKFDIYSNSTELFEFMKKHR